ncbi:MAG: hypothetical protein ACRD0S_12765, partial [Acidimicrobiales bacterium]
MRRFARAKIRIASGSTTAASTAGIHGKSAPPAPGEADGVAGEAPAVVVAGAEGEAGAVSVGEGAAVGDGAGAAVAPLSRRTTAGRSGSAPPGEGSSVQ